MRNFNPKSDFENSKYFLKCWPNIEIFENFEIFHFLNFFADNLFKFMLIHNLLLEFKNLI